MFLIKDENTNILLTTEKLNPLLINVINILNIQIKNNWNFIPIITIILSREIFIEVTTSLKPRNHNHIPPEGYIVYYSPFVYVY